MPHNTLLAALLVASFLHTVYTASCVTGKRGYRCNVECPKRCTECPKHNGQMCQELCLGNCESGCDRYSWQCKSCKPGYTGRYCDTCVKGYTGQHCNETCPAYCEDGCDRETGFCYWREDAYRGRYCTEKGLTTCVECNTETGECFKCKEGFVGRYCNISCPTNCRRCYENGSCYICKNGYIGKHCKKDCPPNCLVCDSGQCKWCKNRYVGSFCNISCPDNCVACYMNGTCSWCEDGFSGLDCKRSCPRNCARCDKDSNVCQICKDGYRGKLCYQSCFKNCKTCNRYTGICMKCKDGYAGTNCTTSCPTNCDSCDKSTLTCNQCKKGYVGSYCNVQCSTNCNGCDHQSMECYKCQDGFFGRICGIPCPQSCAQRKCIKDGGECYSCKPGNWGPFCNNSCPFRCSLCDKDAGVCYGCKTGYMGGFCNEACPSNCKGGCDRYTGICEACVSGYGGRYCRSTCSANCETCSLITGECGHCIDGKKGLYCNETCPSNCQTCARYENQCSGRCIGDRFYGNVCSIPCPKACRTCDKMTGICAECSPGYSRTFCDEMCSICRDPARCSSESCSERMNRDFNFLLAGCGIFAVSILVLLGAIFNSLCVRMRSYPRQASEEVCPTAVFNELEIEDLRESDVLSLSDMNLYRHVENDSSSDCPSGVCVIQIHSQISGEVYQGFPTDYDQSRFDDRTDVMVYETSQEGSDIICTYPSTSVEVGEDSTTTVDHLNDPDANPFDNQNGTETMDAGGKADSTLFIMDEPNSQLSTLPDESKENINVDFFSKGRESAEGAAFKREDVDLDSADKINSLVMNDDGVKVIKCNNKIQGVLSEDENDTEENQGEVDGQNSLIDDQRSEMDIVGDENVTPVTDDFSQGVREATGDTSDNNAVNNDDDDRMSDVMNISDDDSMSGESIEGSNIYVYICVHDNCDKRSDLLNSKQDVL